LLVSFKEIELRKKRSFEVLFVSALLFSLFTTFGCGTDTDLGIEASAEPNASTKKRLASLAEIGEELISDGGFESTLGGFTRNSGNVDGTIDRTSAAISGSWSLRTVIRGYGRIVHYHQYPYGSGPMADSVTVSGKLRVDAASAIGREVEVCSIAYLHVTGNQLTECQRFPVAPEMVVPVSLVLATGGEQLSSVIYQLKLPDSGTITATLDEASLYVLFHQADPPACTADEWSCTDWSACSDGMQGRTCAILNDCPLVETPSPATTQACVETPPPSGDLPTVPDGSTLIDVLVDGDFETSTGSFASDAAGTATRVTQNTIDGTGSLSVTLNPWARFYSSDRDYPYGLGPIGDSVTAKARLRVESGSTVGVCAVAYTEDGEYLTNCQVFDSSSSTVSNVYLSINVGRKPLDRVYFMITHQDTGTATAVLDNAHLYVVGTPAPTPDPGPGPGPGPGPDPTDPTAGDLEIHGFAMSPTRWRSMTAQMDFRNDLSSLGAALNAFPKDVSVKLIPAADAIGQTRRVSFGLPLPPGVVVNTEMIRVTDITGQEIPAFVRSLGKWNWMPDQSLLCNGLTASGNPGIRSVLIQFDMTFTGTSPVTVTVKLNSVRTQSLSAEVPVLDTYRVVNDGTYAPTVPLTPGVVVHEPAVTASIDHRYLSCTSLFPLSSVDGDQPEMAGTNGAVQNFFYSMINQWRQPWPVTRAEDVIPYGTEEEPWLYDRAQVFYNGYLRSGNSDMLREAHRAADHFRQLIWTPTDCPVSPPEVIYPYCVGSFKLKNLDRYNPYQDTKYSTPESLLMYYLLTGDASVLPVIGYMSWASEFHAPLTSENTERTLGYALLAHAIDAELTGSAHETAVVFGGITAMRLRQVSPLDGNAPNGCFNYPPEGQVHTFSPWMSNILAHGLLRGFQATGQPVVPQALIDLAQCEVERGIEPRKATTNGPMPVGYYYPFYIANSFGPPSDADDDNPFNGFEHCADVATTIALGTHFANGAQKANLAFYARELLKTHDLSVLYWTRETPDTIAAGRSKYRLSPSRKPSWQQRGGSPFPRTVLGVQQVY
jgi:hypothetical protein